MYIIHNLDTISPDKNSIIYSLYYFLQVFASFLILLKMPLALTTNLIFKLAEDFVQNSKNANNLAHMIENLSQNKELDSKLTNCCILGLQTMFSHSLPVKKHSSTGSKKGNITLMIYDYIFEWRILRDDLRDAEKNFISLAENAAAEDFRTWLLKNHEEAVQILLRIVKSPKQPYAVREQAMITYMHLLKLESMHINKPKVDDVFCLPKMKYLVKLIENMLFAKHFHKFLISTIGSFEGSCEHQKGEGHKQQDSSKAHQQVVWIFKYARCGSSDVGYVRYNVQNWEENSRWDQDEEYPASDWKNGTRLLINVNVIC